MDRATARETFVLHIASTDDGTETYIMPDLFPTRGNVPTLFCRNDDAAVDATVQVQTSPDRVTWATINSLVVVAKGRDKLSFTSSAKYLRFKLAADAPGGVHCELVQFAFDPAYQAGV